MADYPDDPDDLGDPDMVDDHDHPDLDEDATGGVSPDILLMGLIRAMAAKLQDEDDEDEDNRRRRRPSRRNQNHDDNDDNRSVRLPPVVGKGKGKAASSVVSKTSYSTAARKQLPQLKQQPKQGRSSSSNTSQHKTPVSNADYEGGGGVTSLPMAAQRSQRAEVVKGKRGVVGVGGGARPSTSNSPGSPVPAPAATSTTSTCCDLLTREVLTTTEQVTKQLEKNQADRLKVAKERAQLLTSFQAVTAQFNEVVVKQNLMEGKGAGEAPKSTTTTTTTSNPPSGN